MALEALSQLDPVIQERIVAKVAWLADNFERTTPEPLRRDLRGLYKLRVGHYRAAYAITVRRVITVVMVGHRRDVYRQLALIRDEIYELEGTAPKKPRRSRKPLH